MSGIMYLDISFPNMWFSRTKPIWKNGKSFFEQNGQKIQMNNFCFKLPFLKKPYLIVFIFREVDE